MPQEETPLQQDPEQAGLREENARLNEEIQRLQQSHAQQLMQLRTESAIREGLLRQGARDPRTVLPLLQLDKIQLQDGKLTGLAEQLALLRQESGYLFQDSEGPRVDSGFHHGQPPKAEGPATLAGALAERYR